MNFTASSVLNVRASSSASLITTAWGVSGPRSSSPIAIRRIRRSITAIRSGRQRSAVSAISAIDRVETRHGLARRVPANRCSSSDGGAASGHCSLKNVSIARPMSTLPISH